MTLKHVVTPGRFSLEFWHLGRHHHDLSSSFEMCYGREQARLPLKSTAEGTGSESFIRLLFHLFFFFFQQIYQESVHGTNQICSRNSVMNQTQPFKEYRVSKESLIGHEQLLYKVIGGLLKLKMEEFLL